jgi:hypothetical protein
VLCASYFRRFMAELGDHVLRSRDVAVVGLVAGEDGANKAAALLGRLGPTGGAERRGASFFGERWLNALLAGTALTHPRTMDRCRGLH